MCQRRRGLPTRRWAGHHDGRRPSPVMGARAAATHTQRETRRALSMARELRGHGARQGMSRPQRGSVRPRTRGTGGRVHGDAPHTRAAVGSRRPRPAVGE
jgi:hypothetical protein